VSASADAESLPVPPRKVACVTDVSVAGSRATKPSPPPALVGWAPPAVPGKVAESVRPAT